MSRPARLAIAVAMILALISPGVAFAAPGNDSYASATGIGSLPFSATISTTTATSESGEPSPCYEQLNNSVWYTFTPSSDGVIRVGTFDSSYGAFAQIYVVTGAAFAGLDPLRCGTRQLEVTAATTYAIQIVDTNPSGGGGTLVFTMDLLPPPANDAFASATSVTSLPFTDRIDLAGATIEAGEPALADCISYPPLTASAWYAYSPATDGHLQVLTGSGFESASAIYTGSSIDALTRLECGSRSIAVQAGTTYFIQVAAQSLGKGPIDVTLRQPSAPQAGFVVQPDPPNSASPAQFYDQTFDPGFQDLTHAWTFGDGGTSSLANPAHQYATDGDYLVGLSVATPDGRTDATQRTISVRTHDVAIVNVSAPKSAKSGQTKDIGVSIVDRRYPETVEVRLYRVDEFGQTLITSASRALTVKTKPTTISLPYTFTPADAASGRVTFIATVEIVGHADAVPGDNSRSAVTSVKR